MRVVIRNDQELAQAYVERDELKKAWSKILTAQSYTMGDDQVNRASLARIESELDAYNEAIENYEDYGTSRRRARRAIPLG